MKRLKNGLLTAFAFLLIFLFTGVPAQAIHTGFQLEEMSEERKNHIFEAMNFSVFREEPEVASLGGFDVREDGMLALELETAYNSKRICVYDSQNHFLYGYSFNANGAYHLAWDQGDVLQIYLIRGSILLTVDARGNCLEMYGVPNTLENFNYERSGVFSTQKKVGNQVYLMDDKVGPISLYAGSHSRLIRVAEDGTRTVLFDVSARRTKTFLLVVGAVLVFLVLFLLSMRRIWRSDLVGRNVWQLGRNGWR